MNPWLELVLLIVALAALAVLASDLGRAWLRGREERRHLERLGEGAEPTGADYELPGSMDRQLRAAGLPFGATGYLLISAVLGLFVFLGVVAAFPSSLVAGLLAAGLAAYFPWTLVRAWGRRRARLFEENLVDAVEFIASALQAGENPTQALASAADAAEGAVATELRRTVDHLALGDNIHRALTPMIEGYDSEGTRLFAQTLIAKWPAGGDLASVLRSVNRIIRERLRMRLRLRSELAGARLSGIVVSILPYAVVPVIMWRRPDWIRSLIEHPTGLKLLFIALLLQLLASCGSRAS